jgi:hypothetical protein
MCSRIDFNELSEYLYSCGSCSYCVLRYLRPKYDEFWDVAAAMKKVSGKNEIIQQLTRDFLNREELG